MTHPNATTRSRSQRAVLPLLAILLLLAPAMAQESVLDSLEGTRSRAVSAYNEREWAGAAKAADSYAAILDEADLPHAGTDYALVAFIGGHARFELWKTDPASFSYDFDRDVLGAMHESIHILQDDPFFKHNVLGTAYFEKLKYGNFQDLDLENHANWHLQKALLARYTELRDSDRTAKEYESFARYLLVYIGRAFEMARYSKVPNLFLIRVREACRMGFGTKYSARFAQLYEVVGFDSGNVRAGVLWQTGLDLMNSEGADAEDVLQLFTEAAGVTRGFEERAEIYRQMADFASRQDGHSFRLRAVEFGRLAFKLNPSNEEIQKQFGTSLHVLSYAHYNSGRFHEALKVAQEATSFSWDGDEVAYFDLSRAEANFGEKMKALKDAQRAYEDAMKTFSGTELQPFLQNYANILRQFGLGRRADQIEARAAEGGGR